MLLDVSMQRRLPLNKPILTNKLHNLKQLSHKNTVQYKHFCTEQDINTICFFKKESLTFFKTKHN